MIPKKNTAKVRIIIAGSMDTPKHVTLLNCSGPTYECRPYREQVESYRINTVPVVWRRTASEQREGRRHTWRNSAQFLNLSTIVSK